MKEIVKESCGCGATVEFEQTMEDAWESHAMHLLAEFRKAHTSCRLALSKE